MMTMMLDRWLGLAGLFPLLLASSLTTASAQQPPRTPGGPGCSSTEPGAESDGADVRSDDASLDRRDTQGDGEAENVERMAVFARRYYEALIKQGFSREEALQLAAGAGILAMRTGR